MVALIRLPDCAYGTDCADCGPRPVSLEHGPMAGTDPIRVGLTMMKRWLESLPMQPPVVSKQRQGERDPDMPAGGAFRNGRR